jgi:hypothetical protein
MAKRVAVGAVSGAVGGAFSGFLQNQSGGRILEDAAFGAAFGGLGASPSNGLGQVMGGTLAGAGDGYAQQLVANGWHPSKVSYGAAIVDGGLGALGAGFGVWAQPEDRVGPWETNLMTGTYGAATSGFCGMENSFHKSWC